MPDLIAQGVQLEDRWRRSLPEGRTVVLGRDAGFWSVPWDKQISRRHVQLCWHDDRLEVRRVPASRNPVFVSGAEQQHFFLRPGNHFVIGATTLMLVDERVHVSLDVPAPIDEQTFNAQALKQLRFRDADARIDVLSRIPAIISGAANDQEMYVRVTNVLLSGLPQALAVALVAADPHDTQAEIEVLHWDRRLHSERDFQPSDKLIRQAVQRGESVVHMWGGSPQQDTEVPANLDGEWAFCTPVRGADCQGWAIYVAGSFPTQVAADSSRRTQALQDDVKFTELAATTLSSLRQARQLERNQSSLRQFFSPVVLEVLAGQDPDDVLRPRETEVCVLFCDLRGFARESERSAGNLLGLLNRVSDALGVTTRQILDQGGVVGDFHGDSAMGFWGWPLAQPDAVSRACCAALGIRAELERSSQQTDHALADFQMGIGIAMGRAVAGKIGTVDQVKVTVFGPVVNLAARLEGMTKVLQAPILLDEPVAAAVRKTMPASQARVRRIAVVQPYGFDRSLEVSELLPPESEYPQLRDEHIQLYEAALDALLERDWPQAFQLLHRVPAEDRVKDFLTVFIAQHNRTPPVDFDGSIALTSK